MTAFDEAALRLLDLNWSPIPVRGKSMPAKGATGYDGEVSAAKVMAWLDPDPIARARAGRGVGLDNVGLRHRLTMAIDIDQGYGNKGGVAALAAWTEKQGLPALPATWSSTARGDDSPSRQYLYRLADDVVFKTKPCDSVELCCWHHRFTVCAPTIHPVTGTPYTWYEPATDGTPPGWGAPASRYPAPVDLPMLPSVWVVALRGGVANADRAAAVVELPELFASFPQGDPDGLVHHLIERWSDETAHVGHDEAKNALLNAFMLGREGHPGVEQLFRVIVDRLTAYLGVARPDVADVEVRSLVAACATIAQQKPLPSRDWAELLVQPTMKGASRTVRTQRTVRPANRAGLAGIARTVLTAPADERVRLFQWAADVLWRHVADGHLDDASAARLATGIAEQAGIDPALARSIVAFSRKQKAHA